MSRAQEQSRLAASKAAGERVEATLIQQIEELRYVGDSEAEFYDATPTAAISPSEELPFVGICVLERDLPIEIKSAGVVYGPETQRNGRFLLREAQHNKLLDVGGVYLFVVCVPDDDREIIAAKVVPATAVDELAFSWINRETRSRYTQIAWTRLFSDAEVNGGRQ